MAQEPLGHQQGMGALAPPEMTDPQETSVLAPSVAASDQKELRDHLAVIVRPARQVQVQLCEDRAGGLVSKGRSDTFSVPPAPSGATVPGRRRRTPAHPTAAHARTRQSRGRRVTAVLVSPLRLLER